MWNDNFVNYTSDDAEKLLTGVAPSGSQNKRRREEEQARLAAQQQQQQALGQGSAPMPQMAATSGDEQAAKRPKTME